MSALQYITDSKGRKISVILPLKEYRKMLEDIRLYDEAMADTGTSIPVEEAFAQIDAKRKNG